jgi:hypothetical protein
MPIAMGVIPADFFFGLGMPFQTTFYPVTYLNEGKRKMVKSIFHDWVELYRRDRGQTYAHDWQKHYEDGPMEDFFELFSMLKDEGFKDEHELRVVYRESFALQAFGDQYKARKRFRVVGPLIKPYTTIRDLVELRSRTTEGDKGRVDLAEIVIGPHTHAGIAAAGLREFLDTRGYKGVTISLSKVPYR